MTQKLRYTECFYSIQGEGLHAGVPSVFLRTFGCNFRCQGFGLPRDTKKQKYNAEVKSLLDNNILSNINTFEELPIIKTGCDTYASVYPEFKKYATDSTVDELVDKLISLTPNNDWVTNDGQDIHLIITGGEPLLGWQKIYISLFNHPKMKNLKNVTFETNTTQRLHQEFKDYLNDQTKIKITWSCSPKLSVSGECRTDATRNDVAFEYYSVNNSNMYFKFVIMDSNDVNEVISAIEDYRSVNINCPVYVMPVGGRSEEYSFNSTTVANIALQNGWRYSPRLHIDLFGNAWNT